jgi:cell division protein FtsB
LERDRRLIRDQVRQAQTRRTFYRTREAKPVWFFASLHAKATHYPSKICLINDEICSTMPSKSPSQYTQEEVSVWLNSVGLGSKVDVFKENGIDGQMLVTLTEADAMGYLGLSPLQARKFALSLDFAKSLADGNGGGGNPQLVEALQRENAQLREEVANLKAINKELQDQLMPPAPAPAPPPQQYSAPAPAPPPQHHYAPAPAPRPIAPVLVGAGGGALVSDYCTTMLPKEIRVTPSIVY